MPAHGSPATNPPIGSGPETALARCRAPAWVIDPAKGRVLAANPAGATRLGLRPDAASGTLDAAMPGLVRLRALMREPLNGGRREPLIFWTAYGAESLMCTVRASAGARPPPTSSSSHIFNGEEDQAAPRAASRLAPPARCRGVRRRCRHPEKDRARDPHGLRQQVGPRPRRERGRWRARGAGGAAAPDRQANVSKLAHELRTPLSAIVVAAEIMKDQRFGAMANERYHGYSSDIHDNARHALAVIDRLLAGGAPDEPAVTAQCRRARPQPERRKLGLRHGSARRGGRPQARARSCTRACRAS